MTCTVEKRRRARRCASALRQIATVDAVDVLDPYTDPTQCWTVEIVLCPAADGVPPAVLATCATHGLSIRDVCRQGPYWIAVATV